MPGRSAASGRDSGSMALELALLAPVFFLMLSLILAYGRFASVTGLTESAARDGARAATKSRSIEEARARVVAITAATLATAPTSCATSGHGDLATNDFLPGDFVTVVVTCDIDYSDLGLPGAPGSRKITRVFTSPLDPYRGVR
jgi:Flp pilus assembly protein TadG